MAKSKKEVDAINQAIKTLDDAIKNPKAGRNAAVRQEECARSAIATIRLLQKSTKLSPKDLLLENAISALIGKCISLELYDLAYTELRRLKRSLQDIINKSRKQCDKSAGKSTMKANAAKAAHTKTVSFATKPTTPIETSSLADLLVYSDVSTSESAVAILVLKSQIQALKLLPTKTFKTSALLESVLPVLEPEYPGSIVHLILDMVKLDADYTETAIRNLEIVALVLTALAPGTSANHDKDIAHSSSEATPMTAFALQTLGLRIKSIAWQMQLPMNCFTKAFLVPLNSFIDALSRRHNDPRAVQIAVDNACEQLSHIVIEEPPTHKNVSLSLYVKNSAVADKGGALPDAIKWIEFAEWNKLATSRTQSYWLVALKTALKLRHQPEDPKIADTVTRLSEGLLEKIEGARLCDVERFIEAINAVRRVAIRLISNYRGKESPMGGRLHQSARAPLEELVLLIPRFLRNFIGPEPEANVLAATRVGYEKRLKFVAPLVDATLEAVFYLTKLCGIQDGLNWKSSHLILRDCLDLLLATDGLRPTRSENPHYVKLSHLYWSFYEILLRSKKPGDATVNALEALINSVQCAWQGTEKEKIEAHADAKLERLINFHYSHHQHEDGIVRASHLIDTLIGRGLLRTMVEVADSQPLPQLWSFNDDTMLFARIYIARVMAAQVLFPNKPLECFRMPNVVGSRERGAVLELTLQHFTRKPGHADVVVEEVASTLYSTYDIKQFPIRRLRVYACLLTDWHVALDRIDDVLKTVAAATDEAHVSLSYDTQLKNYASELAIFVLSNVELQRSSPRLSEIRQHLAVWSSLLDECATPSALASRVDDIDRFVLHLNTVSHFLALHDPGATRIAVLKMIATATELQQNLVMPEFDSAMSYIRMSVEYLQLGYSGKANTILQKVAVKINNDKQSSYTMLRYNLAYAAYRLETREFDACRNRLADAELLHKEWQATKEARTTRGKSINAQILAETAMTMSRLAMQEGHLKHAARFARQALRLIYRAWDLVDRGVIDTKTQVELDDDLQLRNESIPQSKRLVPTCTERRVSGPPFWHLIPALFQGLSWLSQIYVHYGMYQEALYYSEQADRVVSKNGIGALSAAALTGSACIWFRAGLLDKASSALTEAKRLAALGAISTITATVQLRNAQTQVVSGHEQTGLLEYDAATKTMDNLMDTSYIEGLDRIVDTAKALAAGMSKLCIVPKTPIAKRPTRSRAMAKRPPVHARAKAKPITHPVGLVKDECIGLRMLKREILHSRSQALLISKRFDEATLSLQAADGTFVGHQEVVQHMLMARLLLAQGLEQLGTDPVYSVLQDSTISYPSVIQNLAIVHAAKPGITTSKSVTPKRQATQRMKAQAPTFTEYLNAAHEHLLQAYASASKTAATHVIHNICSLLNVTGIFISIAGIQKANTASRNPCYVSYPLEIARNMAFERELDISEECISTKQQDLEWPIIKTVEQRDNKEMQPLTNLQSLSQGVADYQKSYIDILPAPWMALSLSLSETRQELCITKLQRGLTPFVLRIPLGRESTSRDMDDVTFDFEQGHRELREIVVAANESAHGARDLKSKAAKTGWWAKRDVLDFRVRELLENIEKVWIGGFKGVFSNRPRNAALLARFQASFTDILDKHLPSRQRTGRKKAVPKVTLDPRILELFVELDLPSEPDSDFSEILTDLLYFVVDILQFHGERNAYDEIDWDRVVVDTIGALEHYHEALLSSSTSSSPTAQHTILIIDKSLHCFPWESMPCLSGQAVSRMPSLGSLRDRILSMSEGQNQARPGWDIARQNGAYILNPSNDLVNTSETFSPLLQSLALSAHKTITSRAPTEDEFLNLLSSSDYLLYFGHGSGTQYIRPKTIRKHRFSKIAVSFLMGCSSGALTEAGEFEAYGTPINYLLAGSPAVVANLWDVTDRDCDRFAVGCLEEWGLFGQRRDGDAEKSLVEAVVVGRGKCRYRYLTAAAVVVYGVPVYVK